MILFRSHIGVVLCFLSTDIKHFVVCYSQLSRIIIYVLQSTNGRIPRIYEVGLFWCLEVDIMLGWPLAREKVPYCKFSI